MKMVALFTCLLWSIILLFFIKKKKSRCKIFFKVMYYTDVEYNDMFTSLPDSLLITDRLQKESLLKRYKKTTLLAYICRAGIAPFLCKHQGNVQCSPMAPVSTLKLTSLLSRLSPSNSGPNLLKVREVSHGLHSAWAITRSRPNNSGFGACAYANYATKVWNALLARQRCARSVLVFCKALRAYYFTHPPGPSKLELRS